MVRNESRHIAEIEKSGAQTWRRVSSVSLAARFVWLLTVPVDEDNHVNSGGNGRT
jgi:hypothetical protein